MSSENPTASSSSIQKALDNAQSTFTNSSALDQVLVISALLLPVAAAVSYVRVQRQLSTLHKHLDVLRTANASLARELRLAARKHPTSSSTIDPLTVGTVRRIRQRMGSLLRDFADVSELFKKSHENLERQFEIGSRKIRDIMLAEAAAAARREGMMQAWQAQTTKSIALLSEEFQRQRDYTKKLTSLRQSLEEIEKRPDKSADGERSVEKLKELREKTEKHFPTEGWLNIRPTRTMQSRLVPLLRKEV